MKILIFILCLLSALYAIPYGTWEWQNNNKLGGFVVYIFSAICIIASIANFFFIS